MKRLAARETLGTMSRPILGMNPGAAVGSAKRWVLEQFAEVARELTEKVRILGPSPVKKSVKRES